MSNLSKVADLEKDKKKLEEQWAAEAARQEKVESEIHDLRNVVAALDNLTIKDKKDVDKLHSETIKQIAQVGRNPGEILITAFSLGFCPFPLMNPAFPPRCP